MNVFFDTKSKRKGGIRRSAFTTGTSDSQLCQLKGCRCGYEWRPPQPNNPCLFRRKNRFSLSGQKLFFNETISFKQRCVRRDHDRIAKKILHSSLQIACCRLFEGLMQDICTHFHPTSANGKKTRDRDRPTNRETHRPSNILPHYTTRPYTRQHQSRADGQGQ